MSVIRIVKDKNFITIGKYHLQEKNMSLKAIGLLSIMLSLPENWNYSVNGLASIRSENRNTINSILQELEEFGYLKRMKIRDEKGKIVEVEYTIYESPYLKNQDMDNQDMEKPDMDNCTQYNNKIINKLNNRIINNNISFKKPTLDEVQKYCNERNNNVNPQKFIDFYESKGWYIGKNKMKDWKACVRTWERSNTQQDLPNWFNKKINKQEITKEEQDELDALLKEF